MLMMMVVFKHVLPSPGRFQTLIKRVEEHVQQAVCRMAIDNPALGLQRVSNELSPVGIFVSPGGVRSIWQRHDLETFKKRLKCT